MNNKQASEPQSELESLRSEKNQLDLRREAVKKRSHDFCIQYGLTKPVNRDHVLLCQQLKAMNEYSKVLGERIEAASVPKKMTMQDIYEYLCTKDSRNPSWKDVYGDWKEEGETPPKPRANCSCDNCHYGRDRLAMELLRLHGMLPDQSTAQ